MLYYTQVHLPHASIYDVCGKKRTEMLISRAAARLEDIMKKQWIAGLLLIALLMTAFASCKQKPQPPAEAPTTAPVEVPTDAQGNPITPGGIGNTRSLNGARILVLGDESFYYGQTVLLKNQYVTDLASRSNDKGFLYQLCASREEVPYITNWTWGGHSLADIMNGHCEAGRGCDGQDHLAPLVGQPFDYVVVQDCIKPGEEILTQLYLVMEFFRNQNPDVHFVFVCHHDAYIREASDPIISLPAIADAGITVVDWGGLLDDLIEGRVAVPGGSMTYDYNSFVVDTSEDQDTLPNLLSGYVLSLMLYGAMSGKTVLEMESGFCLDMDGVEGAVSMDVYTELYYAFGTTNMEAVLESPNEVLGLQTLVDYYLREKPFMKD